MSTCKKTRCELTRVIKRERNYTAESTEEKFFGIKLNRKRAMIRFSIEYAFEKELKFDSALFYGFNNNSLLYGNSFGKLIKKWIIIDGWSKFELTNRQIRGIMVRDIAKCIFVSARFSFLGREREDSRGSNPSIVVPRTAKVDVSKRSSVGRPIERYLLIVATPLWDKQRSLLG